MTLTWDLIHNGISQESMASLIILFGPAIIFCPFFCTLWTNLLALYLYIMAYILIEKNES